MFKFFVFYNEFLRYLKICYIIWIIVVFVDYKYVLLYEIYLCFLWGDDFILFVFGISKVVKKVFILYFE